VPHFSQRSQDRLNSCHPRLIKLFEEVVKYYDCTILEGYRTPERQKELVEQGFSKTLDSRHARKPSLAVDVIPYPFKSSDWTNMKRFYHFQGFVKGTCLQMQRDGRLDASFELVSGLDWDGDNDLDDQSFMDGPHFEIRELAEKS